MAARVEGLYASLVVGLAGEDWRDLLDAASSRPHDRGLPVVLLVELGQDCRTVGTFEIWLFFDTFAELLGV